MAGLLLSGTVFKELGAGAGSGFRPFHIIRAIMSGNLARKRFQEQEAEDPMTAVPTLCRLRGRDSSTRTWLRRVSGARSCRKTRCQAIRYHPGLKLDRHFPRMRESSETGANWIPAKSMRE